MSVFISVVHMLLHILPGPKWMGLGEFTMSMDVKTVNPSHCISHSHSYFCLFLQPLQELFIHRGQTLSVNIKMLFFYVCCSL